MAVPSRFKFQPAAILLVSLMADSVSSFLGNASLLQRPAPERQTFHKRFVGFGFDDLPLEEFTDFVSTSTSDPGDLQAVSHLFMDADSLDQFKAFLCSSFKGDKVNVETEALQDVNHLLVDFSIYATKSPAILQVFAILGRFLSLYQDYLPDHYIPPEEVGMQVAYIVAVALKMSR